MNARALGALLVLLPVAAGASETRLRAERIGASGAPAFGVSGPDATGGESDWGLSNGTLCAVVADPSHETDLAATGGVLVDLGHCGRGDDQLVFFAPLVNASLEGAPPVQRVRAHVDPDEARLVSEARADGIHLETTYSLDRADPTRLRVVARLEREADAARVFALGSATLHGDTGLRAFALRTRAPAESRGFDLAKLDSEDLLGAVRALEPADAQVLLGAHGQEPPISYGVLPVAAWREGGAGNETRTPLPQVALTTPPFSGTTAFARPFWLGGGSGVGLLELAQTPFMNLPPGEVMVFEWEIRLSPTGDVASITDRLYADGGVVRGRVDDPRARLLVHRAGGGAVTQVRPAADGSFSYRAPLGQHVVWARAPGGGEQRREITVGAGSDTRLGALALGEAATLRLPRGIPMRLVFRGLAGTPDPDLGDDLLRPGALDGGPSGPADGQDGWQRNATWSHAVHLAGVPADPASVSLAPGRYRVFATRGPEYDVAGVDLELAAGEHAVLEIEAPARAVDSTGWVGADLHVHGAASDDTTLALARQLTAFVSEGVDVLVATDHDNVADYGPVARDLELLTDRIATMVGVEVSASVASAAAPYTLGHANVLPWPHRPSQYRGGAPANEGRRLRDVIAQVRGIGGTRIVQLNHARASEPGVVLNALFSHLSVVGEPFDPALPLSAAPNRALVERDPDTGLRDLDFDAMELLNGPDLARYRALRTDWFALLRQGEVRTATANSDSHRLETLAGLPRTWVRLEPDDPGRFDAEAFVLALRRGHAFGSTGPLVFARLGDAGPGDRYRGARGTLSVDVRAPAWISVDTIRVFIDGRLHAERPVASGDRFVFALDFERDAFVTVEVERTAASVASTSSSVASSSSSVASSAWAELAPGAVPFAFTNPIFVDADGDGSWTPPGL